MLHHNYTTVLEVARWRASRYNSGVLLTAIAWVPLMLDREQIDRIVLLIAAGQTSEEIATLTGFDQAAIARLVADRRRDSMPSVFRGQIIGRCPSCGSRVYLPCLACNLRKQLVGGKLQLRDAFPNST